MVIVPVNSWKDHTSSEYYIKAIDRKLLWFTADKPLGMLVEHSNHSLAACELQILHVLPTPCMVYQHINHKLVVYCTNIQGYQWETKKHWKWKFFVTLTGARLERTGTGLINHHQ